MPEQKLPPPVRSHLESLAAELGKAQDPEFIRRLSATWERKAKLFVEQAKALNLLLVDEVPEGDVRGMLILSYSGSLLSVAPRFPESAGRWIEYSSIKLRTDVPDIVVERQANLAGPVRQGESVALDASQLKRTSAVHAIALCPAELSLDEQDKRIRECTIFLTNGFMKFNRSLAIDKSSIPDQFTMKSMTRYLAKKHDMTGVEAKQLMDDFVTLLETGMLLGETVPLGRIGKLSIRAREAQKARLVKHPVSGEEILVEAKPSMGVPKISFSSYLKERAASIDLSYPIAEEGAEDEEDQED